VTTPVICARCLAPVERAGGAAFCPSCGAPLGRSQRTTGRLEALGAAGNAKGLREEWRGAWARLARNPGASDALLAEGKRLEGVLAAWDFCEDRPAALAALLTWVRAVGPS
jgi:hypothetical protein